MEKRIEKILIDACNKLYKKDSYLIKHRVSERAIVFRLGIYIQELMNIDDKLNGYHLDNEYNRNMDEPKRILNHQCGVVPDLIIHKRGSNQYNIAVVECKTYWNNNNEKDIEKINYFINSNNEYNYSIGISIIFMENQIEYIINNKRRTMIFD